VHLEIVQGMGDVDTRYIESNHAANISHDRHCCRGTIGSF
jgi:hypothetical protein